MKLVGRSSRETLTLPLRISNDPLVTSGKVKKSKKKISEQKKSRSLEEPSVPETPKTVKNSPLTRSKTYDLTTAKNLENEAGLERRRASSSNLPKHKITFHRVFKEVPEDEDLVDSFSCAWQKEVLYQGRLYISPNYVSFYCTMLRKEIKVLITIVDIAVLKKANTALLVPNALCIKTVEGEKRNDLSPIHQANKGIEESAPSCSEEASPFHHGVSLPHLSIKATSQWCRYLFGSLRNREIAYQALWALCPHLQDGSPSNSPLSSPADTSSEQCKKTLNSSQSDLEHELPEEEPSFAFPDVPDGGGSVHSRVKIEDDVKKSPPPTTRSKGECSNPKTSSRASWQNLSSINILLIVYLMLVVVLLLSSGYIGLRIVELEQQLTLMGAWPEMNLQSGYKES